MAISIWIELNIRFSRDIPLVPVTLLSCSSNWSNDILPTDTPVKNENKQLNVNARNRTSYFKDTYLTFQEYKWGRPKNFQETWQIFGKNATEKQLINGEQKYPKSNNAMESEISFSGLEYLARFQLRNCGAASVGEYSR